MPTNKKKFAATSPGGANTCAPSLGKGPKVEYDRGEFSVIEGVPIFDAHSGEEEHLPIDFDGDLLEKICEQCNARITDTGDLVPVTDRHTSDEPGAPEPDLLGFAHNFRVGAIGRDEPRPCIYCDMKIFDTKMAKVKRLPRRSIELWPDLVIDPVVLKGAGKHAIDSVALLGAQRPARDLGLLFAKNSGGSTRYRYDQLVATRRAMNPEELIKQVIEAISNMPEFAWVRDQMDKTKMKEDEDDPEAFSEEEKMKDPEDEDKAKMKEDDEDDDVEPAKLRMQRDQERRRYSRLDSQYKALFAKVEALEKDKRAANRKADLLALEGEGYDFDLADELEYVSDMEPQRYSKHLNKIKKHYRKAPVGVNVTPAGVRAEGGVEPVAARPQDVYAKVASHYKSGKTFDRNPAHQEGN